MAHIPIKPKPAEVKKADITVEMNYFCTKKVAGELVTFCVRAGNPQEATIKAEKLFAERR